MVEAVGVFQDGSIAAHLHIGEDVGNSMFDRGVCGGLKRQQRIELSLKIRGGGIELA